MLQSFAMHKVQIYRTELACGQSMPSAALALHWQFLYGVACLRHYSMLWRKHPFFGWRDHRHITAILLLDIGIAPR
jgi:hypothetical protein